MRDLSYLPILPIRIDPIPWVAMQLPDHQLQELIHQKKMPKISLLRDDLLHPVVSGNKWRKLSYLFPQSQSHTLHIQSQIQSPTQSPIPHPLKIMSVGGFHSNHIDALSYAGAYFGWIVRIWVRGLTQDQLTHPQHLSPTLQRALQNGTDLIPCSRQVYDTYKSLPHFGQSSEDLTEGIQEWIWLEEGGSTAQAIESCSHLVEQVKTHLATTQQPPFTHIGVSIGSGTTAYGIMTALHTHETLRIYSPFKSQSYVQTLLQKQREKYAHFKKTYNEKQQIHLSIEYKDQQELGKVHICTHTHCGGFAKVTPELIHWMNGFYAMTKIPLDPIYTGKMMYALRQDLITHQFTSNDHIILVHTGGLQGIEGMNQRLAKKGKEILNFASTF